MQLLPAIDLKDGKCVRLFKGDFATVHQVADDPVQTAAAFQAAGADMIHMVDLDGALLGEGKNREIIRRVAESVGVKIELGGGIRSMESLEAAFDAGVTRAVIGSAAVENPEFVREAVARYGSRIAVGVDAKDGMVKTRGWTTDGGRDYIEFSKEMESFGVQTIIFTDIDTDGMLKGPAIERLKALRAAVGCRIVASGGVTTIDDIRALKNAGIDAAILGKAIYAGTIDLKEAIAIAQSSACEGQGIEESR